MRKKIFRVFCLLLLASVPLAIIICNQKIVAAADGKLYNNTNEIPYNKVGLLLGTSKLSGDGYINLYYDYRIKAAVDLIKSGKIKYLIISGDNKTADYNEPEMMRRDLIEAGVDSSLIYLDFAGFRTFDSIVRLHEVFGQDSVTVISQAFHNERALFIASKESVYAIGFNAADVDKSMGMKTQLREKLARVKVYLDYLTNKQPKYLGAPVVIPET